MNVNSIKFLLDASKSLILHFELALFSIVSATKILVIPYGFMLHYISLYVL